MHGLWSGFSEGLLVELASGKKQNQNAGDTTSKSENEKIGSEKEKRTEASVDIVTRSILS